MLVAISPQTQTRNAEVKQKHQLGFPVLSDPGNAYARKLSLVFNFSEELKKTYEGFGISLPDYNGDVSWTLPLPARIVVDTQGIIRSLDADPDYTRRPEVESSLDALRAL